VVQHSKNGGGKAKSKHDENKNGTHHGDDMGALVALNTEILGQVEHTLHIGCVAGEHYGQITTPTSDKKGIAHLTGEFPTLMGTSSTKQGRYRSRET
jgi:hypothetical protein